jgi:class 3 adenylate cyclase/tetratricopeptide (TPR) repeat protein
MACRGRLFRVMESSVLLSIEQSVIKRPGGNTMHDNPASKTFGGDCGALLANRCPKCGVDNPPAKRFCGDCGAVLSASSAVPWLPAASGSGPESPVTAELIGTSTSADGERKTITALFADLKDSTELIRELDPEGARAIIDPALKIMVDAVRQYDGYVVQSTGDGIFALFGAPLAHEDHPQRALYAALQIQERLQQYAQRLADRSRGSAPLKARVGVNTGEVVMRTVETGGRVEYAPVGYATNLAARMQTVASPGGIAISEETRRLVEGYFELHALGPTEIKGVLYPVNVYEVARLGPLRTHFHVSQRRGLTKFVGRENELAQMKRAFELARTGRGQIVAVVAEAGNGKSRLLYEFKQNLIRECILLEAWSVSHGKASPWLPVLELLRGYFHFQDMDDAATRREKVCAKLAALDPALSDSAPYLWNLLAVQEQPDPLSQMDAQVKHSRTLQVLKRVILCESRDRPIVVIFEDLHWIDAATQALLDALADGIANARVMLLVNYRPEYCHQWSNKSYYSQLRLEALDSGAADEMLTSLLGNNAELDPLKRIIIKRTEGNPFFIEEILQALFDEGALVRNGVVKITRPLLQLRLPSTVQGILASRIDRQPGEQKQLLQTLAVIGRESRLGFIRRIVPTAEPQLQWMLAELQTSEFIYERSASPDTDYVFKHALTQEVAYNSLLIERRKVLHERAGQVLESMFPDHLDDHVSELARHYSNSDNIIKAVEYLGRAGQQALQRIAPADATSNLFAALNLLQKLPDNAERIHRELTFEIGLVTSLSVASATTDVGLAISHSLRAEKLLSSHSGCTAEGDLLIGKAIVAHAQFLTQDGLAVSQRAMEIGQSLNSAEIWCVAAALHGHFLCVSGKLAAGFALMDQAFERAQRGGELMPLFAAAWLRGFSYLLLWDPSAAKRTLQLGLAGYHGPRGGFFPQILTAHLGIAQIFTGTLASAGSSLAMAPHQFLEANLLFFKGQWGQAEELFTLQIERSHRAQSKQQHWAASLWLARLKRVEAQFDRAVELLTSTSLISEALLRMPEEIATRSELALVQLARGKIAEARSEVVRCRTLLSEVEDWRGLAAFVDRAEAGVLALEGLLEEASKRFTKAIKVFSRYRIPWEVAETLITWGTHLIRAAKIEEGIEKLNAALQIYQHLALGPRWLSRIEQLRVLGRYV